MPRQPAPAKTTPHPNSGSTAVYRLKHLTEKEALNVVAAALKVAPSGLRNVEATLMFRPGDITHVRTYPFWRVRVGDRTLYVDQLGTLYDKLLPAIPGD